MAAESPARWYAEADLQRDDPEQPGDRQADNVAAFLDMLAHAEGTDRYGDADGYNVLVGAALFDGYDDHPRESVYLPAYDIHSTAAGRYQFLIRTWDDLANRLDLHDFTPASQDAGAVALIYQNHGLEALKAGRVVEAIEACRSTWASLPGAGYGQREVEMDRLVRVYRDAGGHVAD